MTDVERHEIESLLKIMLKCDGFVVLLAGQKVALGPDLLHDLVKWARKGLET